MLIQSKRCGQTTKGMNPLRLWPLAMIALAQPGFAAPASQGSSVTDPVQIDRAVEAFTGAAVGEVGGALAPADRRLRLAACAQPLETAWHGTTRSAVRVECRATLSGTDSWRIFVATRSNASARNPASTGQQNARQSAPAIKRGDPVTVVVRGRGFSVQQTGEAMENGQVGDWIGIRTTRRGEPVRARIERPGLAVIPVG